MKIGERETAVAFASERGAINTMCCAEMGNVKMRIDGSANLKSKTRKSANFSINFDSEMLPANGRQSLSHQGNRQKSSCQHHYH